MVPGLIEITVLSSNVVLCRYTRFRYLQNGNILAARTFLNHFLAQITSKHPELVSSVQSSPISVGKPQNGGNDEIILTKDPVLNFAQLAVRTCQRAQGDKNKGMREAWVRLCGTYQSRGGILARPEVRKVSTPAHAREFANHRYSRPSLFPILFNLISFQSSGIGRARRIIFCHPSASRTAGESIRRHVVCNVRRRRTRSCSPKKGIDACFQQQHARFGLSVVLTYYTGWVMMRKVFLGQFWRRIKFVNSKVHYSWVIAHQTIATVVQRMSDIGILHPQLLLKVPESSPWIRCLLSGIHRNNLAVDNDKRYAVVVGSPVATVRSCILIPGRCQRLARK